MSSSIVSPKLAQPKVCYQPINPEARRALDIVLKAYPSEHLCCYGHEAGVAQIGYWRRGTGLLGPNHFVALGEGCILDEAVLDAARKITHPLTLVTNPTAAELALHEMAEAMARAVCPFCAERPNAHVSGGAVDPTPRMNYQTNPDVPIYWHYYVATDMPARPCVAWLLRTAAELYIANQTASNEEK